MTAPTQYENRGEEFVQSLCMAPMTDAYQTTWLEEVEEGSWNLRPIVP